MTSGVFVNIHIKSCHSSRDYQASFYSLFIQGLRLRVEVWGGVEKEGEWDTPG